MQDRVFVNRNPLVFVNNTVDRTGCSLTERFVVYRTGCSLTEEVVGVQYRVFAYSRGDRVFAYRRPLGGETDRWWLGASRSKESPQRACKTPTMASNDCESAPGNDAGLALS